MAKYIKFYIDSDADIEQIFNESVKFGSDKFKAFKMFVWDTEATDRTFTHSAFISCGRVMGQVNGRKLVCGDGDYFCPECLPAR